MIVLLNLILSSLLLFFEVRVMVTDNNYVVFNLMTILFLIFGEWILEHVDVHV